MKRLIDKYPDYFRVIDIWAKEEEKRRDRRMYALSLVFGVLLGGVIVVWGYLILLIVSL